MDFYFLSPVDKLGGTNHSLPRQKDALEGALPEGLQLVHFLSPLTMSGHDAVISPGTILTSLRVNY